MPPAYYAHLAALRGRLWMTQQFGDNMSESSAGSGGRQDRGLEQVAPLPEVKGNVIDSMFYC